MRRPWRVRSIAEKSISKFRNTVEQTMQREKQTQLSFLEAEAALHDGHRNAQILSHKIERRITDYGGEEDAFLPKPIFVSDFCGVSYLVSRNRRGCEYSQKAAKCRRL